MSRKRRAVLIGDASHAFAEHGTFLENSPDVELVGIVEPCPQTRAQLQLDYPKLKVSDDPTDLCHKTGADIALICTPPTETCSAIAMVLDYCRTILVEKPGGTEPDELERLAALATAQGVHVTVGYYYRFHSQVQIIADAYQKLPAGPARTLKLNLSGSPALPHTWRADPRLGGGALYDLGIQLIDLAWQIAGPIYFQDAAIQTHETPEDEVKAIYETADGGRVEIHARYHPESDFSLEAACGDETYSETLWGRGLVSALLRRTLHGSIDTARDAALASWWQHALNHDDMAPDLYDAIGLLRMAEQIEATIHSP